jgi:hypothetical protein
LATIEYDEIKAKQQEAAFGDVSPAKELSFLGIASAEYQVETGSLIETGSLTEQLMFVMPVSLRKHVTILAEEQCRAGS